MEQYMKVVKLTLQWLVVAFMVVLFIHSMIYLFKPAELERPDGDLIAVIDFDGIILESDTVTDIFRELEEDSQIKGYVLRVNSGGGLVTPSQEIYEYLLTVTKPLYVAMGTAAASGGYMVSLPANKIYAMPSTITGSIGVIMQIPNYEGLYDKIGLSENVIKSGVFKDAGSPSRPMTDDERAVLSELVMDMYDQFTQVVSTRRNMDIAQVRQLADGRVYTGRMAKDNGLVDEIGSWHDAFIAMRQDLNMPDVEYYIYEGEDENSWEAAFSRVENLLNSKVSTAIRPAGFYFMSEY
jgi:protease-4